MSDTTIGRCDYFVAGFQVLFTIGINLFFTVSSTTLSHSLLLEMSSIWFIIYIVLSWIHLLSDCKKLFLTMKYLGDTIPSNIWNQLIKRDKIFDLINLIRFCIGCYFMSQTGPFFNSCSIYKNDQNTCISLQYIAFITFLEALYLGIMLLLIIAICCYFAMRSNPSSGQNSSVNSVMVSATSFLDKYNPIPLPELDTKCIICLETVDESGDQQWTELECKHKFHQTCLLQWFRYNPSCPYCQSHINTEP